MGKLTSKGMFCRTISSSTGKHFPNRSVTPCWEFVVAPAGYNFTANTTPLSSVTIDLYIMHKARMKQKEKKWDLSLTLSRNAPHKNFNHAASTFCMGYWLKVGSFWKHAINKVIHIFTFFHYFSFHYFRNRVLGEGT